MFIGHLGFGMILKKADNRLSLSWLFLSVLFLDLLLWIFILLGWEEAIIPANYAEIHFLRFVFPYSHSLMASLIWSLLGFTLAYNLFKIKPLQAGLVVFLGVFSHFFLDYLEHPPQIPLMGENSLKLGLGLWNHLIWALGLEFLLLVVGFYFYYTTSKAKNGIGKYGMLILMSLLTFMAFAGQLTGPPPPSASGLAITSFIMNLLVCILAFWLDKFRVAK